MTSGEGPGLFHYIHIHFSTVYLFFFDWIACGRAFVLLRLPGAVESSFLLCICDLLRGRGRDSSGGYLMDLSRTSFLLSTLQLAHLDANAIFRCSPEREWRASLCRSCVSVKISACWISCGGPFTQWIPPHPTPNQPPEHHRGKHDLSANTKCHSEPPHPAWFPWHPNCESDYLTAIHITAVHKTLCFPGAGDKMRNRHNTILFSNLFCFQDKPVVSLRNR